MFETAFNQPKVQRVLTKKRETEIFLCSKRQ